MTGEPAETGPPTRENPIGSEARNAPLVEGAQVAVELRGVTARYATSRESPLVDASLAVRPGDLVSVLGPNGAGKSTLLRVLAGMLVPSAGQAFLFGRPIEGMDRRTIARKVAVVSQSEQVAFSFSVRDVIMMGRAPHQEGWMRSSAEDRRIVDEAVVRCDLVALADRAVGELSGGEQKRVAIARALAQEPRVLLLDEPAAFLDVKHQLALFDLLRQEVESHGLACVVVMHDLNMAAQYASRVVLAKSGRLIASGSIDDVMTYARLRETFDCDLYVGKNELNGSRFFLPMRARKESASDS